jgi:hypothetical protein
METEWIVSPEEVIRHVRDILDRPVVDGKGIGEEIVPKRFESQKRTLNEWISGGEKLVIPKERSLEGG